MNTLSIVLVSLFAGFAAGTLVISLLVPNNEIKEVHKYFELFNIKLKTRKNDNNKREENAGSKKQKHGNEKRQNRKHSTKGNNPVQGNTGNK